MIERAMKEFIAIGRKGMIEETSLVNCVPEVIPSPMY